jgi:tetratricopeptide (TPR) repeat protein
VKLAAIAAFLALPLCAKEAQWAKLTSSNFEVFTLGSDRDARDLLRVFEQIRGFFQKASPVPLLEQFPVRIVVFNSKEQFAYYSPNAASVAFFASNRKTDYIVMQEGSPESHQFAIHEYLHLLIRHSGLRLPVWLNEGWADVYSTMRAVRGGVAVGDLIPGRVRELEGRKWLDFDTLTSVTTSSRIYSESNRAGIFYAESWALVHMLFLSPEYAPGFPKFLIAVHAGKTAAEACQIAWERSPAEVYRDLEEYLNRRKLFGRIFEAPLGKSEGGAAAVRVDAFDARLMLAELTFTVGRLTDAKREYEELSRTQPGNAEIAESLGYLAMADREAATARGWFEKAFAAGDRDPRMCFELGLMRVASRDFGGALDALMSIKKVRPERATPLFMAIAYSYFETGDLDKAHANALTAKKYAPDAKQSAGVDQLLGIIEARAKSALAPRPGEKTESVAGVLKSIECSDQHIRLVLLVGDKPMSFELPEGNAVEFTHNGDNSNLQLACGAQPPLALVVDYAPVNGAVRRIEY